jgi:O-antigen ligase/tetratricopeptide (TPR) repeat protein
MSTLDGKAIRTVFGALALGFGAALAAGCVGVIEALPYCTLEEVLQSRLRILGLHPNLGAALVGIGLCVTVGWTLMGEAPGASQAQRGIVGTKRRAIGSLLLAVGGVALYLTGSRAGGLGALVGLGTLIVLLKSRLLPRLTGRVLIGLTGIGAVLFLLFLTPLGDGVRESLDAKSQTQSALGQRWHIWKMAAAATMDHPVTGIGGLGFSAHAQYAQPSYYDGTTQTFHTHNILLAAASGAGLPGLLLFLGWLVGFFHLGLSACRRATADRPLFVALVAASFGLLVSNLFDLGQSQLTLLPLFFWLSASLFGAKLLGLQPATSSSKEANLSKDKAEPLETGPPLKALKMAPFLPLAALFALWPMSVANLAGKGLLDSAGGYALAGDLNASAARVELSLMRSLSPERTKARSQLDNQYKRLKLTELRLSSLARWTEETPESALPWRIYGEALLESRRYSRAQVVLAESSRLDPFGASMGRTSMLRAWAALESGDLDAASQYLLAGFRGAAKPPAGMGKRREAKGVVFLGGGLELRLGDLLADLGAQLVELAKTDQVRARRDLTGLIEGFRFDGNLAAASKWIEGVIDASPAPIRATYFQWIELELEVGNEDAARSIFEGMELGGETYRQDLFLGLVDKKSGDPDPIDIGASDLDIFFMAGRLFDSRLKLAIHLGKEAKVEESLHELQRALFDCRSEATRARICSDYLLEVPATPEQRQDGLVRLLWNSNLSRKATSHAERYRRVIAHLAGDYGGDLGMLEQACRKTIDSHGELGQSGLIFLDVLKKEAAKSRP